MHYLLSEPIRGCTHFVLNEVAYTAVELVCGILLGSVEGGAFVPDPMLRPIRRSIQGQEREAFLFGVAENGAPLGEWRDADLADWLNTVGVLAPE